MKIRAAFFTITLLSAGSLLWASDIQIPHPSIRLAKSLEASQNYADAILVYDKLLETYPNDHDLVKLLLHCHDLERKADMQEAVTLDPSIESDRKAMPDLPDLEPEPKNVAALPPTTPTTAPQGN